MLNLEKVLVAGEIRWLGQNYNSLSPQETIIAGKSIDSISKAINLPCYQFERFSTENFFVAHDSEKIVYAFANPRYAGYRKTFQKLVGQIPAGFHVDHVLSRNLAIHIGYKYVLLCMIPGAANSGHGRYERIVTGSSDLIPDVCFCDERIFHKILSRKPLARQKREEMLDGYNPESIPTFGLTLKQKGLWNSAFGFYHIDMTSLIINTSVI